MAKASKQTSDPVEIVAYNPRWADIYAAERESILAATGFQFVDFEHMGSTAIPGQRAKPIIDMMAAVVSLNEVDALILTLNNLGYQLIETGMPKRLFLRKRDEGTGQVFHLHIVEFSTWDERKERLMRDYLLEHPEAVKAYSGLKDSLATTYANDSLAYTKAKTDFIQGIIDKARDGLGLPRIDVWED